MFCCAVTKTKRPTSTAESNIMDPRKGMMEAKRVKMNQHRKLHLKAQQSHIAFHYQSAEVFRPIWTFLGRLKVCRIAWSKTMGTARLDNLAGEIVLWVATSEPGCITSCRLPQLSLGDKSDGEKAVRFRNDYTAPIAMW